MKTMKIECPSCGQHYSMELCDEEITYKCKKCNAEFVASLVEDEQQEKQAEMAIAVPTEPLSTTPAKIPGPPPRRRRGLFIGRYRKTESHPAMNSSHVKSDLFTKAILSVIALSLIFISIMQFLTFRHQNERPRNYIQKVELIGYGPSDYDEDYEKTALRVEVVNNEPLRIEGSVDIDDSVPIDVRIQR